MSGQGAWLELWLGRNDVLWGGGTWSTGNLRHCPIPHPISVQNIGVRAVEMGRSRCCRHWNMITVITKSVVVVGGVMVEVEATWRVGYVGGGQGGIGRSEVRIPIRRRVSWIHII